MVNLECFNRNRIFKVTFLDPMGVLLFSPQSLRSLQVDIDQAETLSKVAVEQVQTPIYRKDQS